MCVLRLPLSPVETGLNPVGPDVLRNSSASLLGLATQVPYTQAKYWPFPHDGHLGKGAYVTILSYRSEKVSRFVIDRMKGMKFTL